MALGGDGLSMITAYIVRVDTMDDDIFYVLAARGRLTTNQPHFLVSYSPATGVFQR